MTATDQLRQATGERAIGPGAFRILVTLAVIQGRGGLGFATIQDVATRDGTNVSNVHQSLLRLESVGLAERVERGHWRVKPGLKLVPAAGCSRR